jgi:AcrR family transcriptional regulator
VSPRRYRQRQRAEAAAETRRRILDAVLQRLEETPSRAVSVDQVARMAGVSRSMSRRTASKPSDGGGNSS